MPAAGPRAGTWYGGDPDEGAVLFDVVRRGKRTFIADVQHWQFGRTCRRVDSVEGGGRSPTRLLVGADGRFATALSPGVKVAISGRVEGRVIRMKVRPTQGTKAERRCYTRTFRARRAEAARLEAGRWRGSVAGQAAVDSVSGPEPAQSFRFRVRDRGRVFVGDGRAIRISLRCDSDREPSKGFTTDLFDLSRPVEPGGRVTYQERQGDRDVRWTLTATSRTAVQGTIRVRDESSRGEPCDSGDIPVTAERR